MHNGMHVVVAHMALGVFTVPDCKRVARPRLLQLLAQRPQASHRGATQRVGRYAKTVLATCCVPQQLRVRLPLCMRSMGQEEWGVAAARPAAAGGAFPQRRAVCVRAAQFRD